MPDYTLTDNRGRWLGSFDTLDAAVQCTIDQGGSNTSCPEFIGRLFLAGKEYPVPYTEPRRKISCTIPEKEQGAPSFHQRLKAEMRGLMLRQGWKDLTS